VTYDESQRDEARRIGYVAVTRAKRLNVWMAKARDDSVMNELFEVPNVVSRADVGQLLREID
jgi:ATP-dependent exoDNAse (exonuclease V) beta subunit